MTDNQSEDPREFDWSDVVEGGNFIDLADLHLSDLPRLLSATCAVASTRESELGTRAYKSAIARVNSAAASYDKSVDQPSNRLQELMAISQDLLTRLASGNHRTSFAITDLMEEFRSSEYGALATDKQIQAEVEFAQMASEQDWPMATITFNKWIDELGMIGSNRNQESIRIMCREFCSNVDVIRLANNSLGEIPQSLDAFINLEVLDLSGNSILTIPEWLGLLPLTELNLANNRIANVPLHVGTLTSLTELDLTHNLLTDLPNEIMSLPNLATLYLGENGIAEIPLPGDESVLETIYVYDNGLTSVENFAALSRLHTLDCSMNSLGSIRELTDLNLSVLNASDNVLEALPLNDEFYSTLDSLDLSNNKLVELPIALASLNDWSELHLEGNPLNQTMSIAFAAGLDVLKSYLRSLKEETNACNEAKLIVMGEGDVGKTSLVAALAGDPFVVDRPTTHGIHLQTLDLEDSLSGLRVLLHTWDFGGQFVYRVTHQFYLSQESIILIVWRPRDGFEQGGLFYWLESVRKVLGDRAKVFLVSTFKHENRSTWLNLEELKYRYFPLIQDYLQVDNSDGDGIAVLQNAIATSALGLSHIGDPLAVSWLTLRENLLNLNQPFVSRGDYEILAAQLAIERDAALTWLRLMHAIGELIYFDDDMDLSTTIVSNPELLARAVDLLLENGDVRAANGAVSHRDIVEIWTDGLPEVVDQSSVFPFLLRLMERSDISVRFEDGKSSLFSPCIGQNRPLDLPWEPGDPVAMPDRELWVHFRFDYQPTGLIPLLIARIYRFASMQYWASGFYGITTRGEAVGIVELIKPTELRIAVRGKFPTNFFASLMSEVEALSKSRWPHLNFDCVVPCPSCISRRQDPRGEFRVESLHRAIELEIEELRCSECLVEVTVTRLLMGFEPKVNEPLGQRFQELSRTLEKRFDDLGTQLATLGGQNADAYAILEEVSRGIREIRHLVSLQASDTPRLFTISAAVRTPLNRAQFWNRQFHLQLWCEQPSMEHPWGNPYSFKRDKAWFVRAQPLMKAMMLALKITPIVGRVVPDLRLTEKASIKEWDKVLGDLESMAALLDVIEESETESPSARSSLDRMSPVGAELRVIKELLNEIDRERAFRGLFQVQRMGDVLWVCEDHVPEYNPGLPELPISDAVASH